MVVGSSLRGALALNPQSPISSGTALHAGSPRWNNHTQCPGHQCGVELTALAARAVEDCPAGSCDAVYGDYKAHRVFSNGTGSAGAGREEDGENVKTVVQQEESGDVLPF